MWDENSPGGSHSGPTDSSEASNSDDQVVSIHSRDGGSGGDDDGFGIVFPDAPEATIRKLAASDDAERRVEDYARSLFWMRNPVDHVAEPVEEVFRHRADVHERDILALEREATQHPLRLYTITTRPIDADGIDFHRRTGQVALLLMGLLIAALLVGVATGIQQSAAIPAVTRDWPLGMLFGITAVAGFLGSKLIRNHLAPTNRIRFDLLVGAATIAALGYWLATFAPTFLSGGAKGTGLAGLKPVSLEAFYIAHLLLDFCGSASLAGLVEYGVTNGRRPVSISNPVRDQYREHGDLLDAEARKNRQKAERCTIERMRFEQACESFVVGCLASLEQHRAERAYGHAAAEANYHKPSIVPISEQKSGSV